MGEGWGLVSFEHGASGPAVIVPDHTSCAELWRGRSPWTGPGRGSPRLRLGSEQAAMEASSDAPHALRHIEPALSIATHHPPSHRGFDEHRSRPAGLNETPCPLATYVRHVRCVG